MQQLADRTVVIAGVENAVGAAVLRRCTAAGARVAALPEPPDDALDAGAWSLRFADCRRVLGPPQIVVNARHFVTRGSIAAVDGAVFGATFRRIASANWLVQQQAVLALRAAGGGTLINITSVLARLAAADCAALCAAARGVLMASRSAALECARAKDRVIVNAVLAGRIDEDPLHWPDGALLPHAPPVRADDVAAAALFLATDGAAYMTGVEWPVDGGWLAGLGDGVT
ncbi:MAG: SDR family oxidoreductase [Steroidobacteraceae bacterium]|nr:SDR family oxidoreductase [Steroidobacteraceae bacterium]MDW8258397.1 SDR family oxidoreductase [Gammaproteobacteria bacterium]